MGKNAVARVRLEERRQPRYPYSLYVQVKGSIAAGTYETVNIGLEGCFVATRMPPSEGHLLPMVVYPKRQQELEFVGYVRQVIQATDAQGHPPGMGVEIFTMRELDQARWAVLVEQIANEVVSPSGQHPVVLDERKGVSIVERLGNPRFNRRRHPRYITTLHVRMKDVQSMLKLVSHNVSGGGMFVKTHTKPPVGEVVDLALEHPVTRARLDVRGRVVRRTDDGVGIEFIEINDLERRALIHFVVMGQSKGTFTPG